MSSPSRPFSNSYPPTASGYPQFIVPFGDASGKRAAVRLFLGVKDARKIDAEKLDFQSAIRSWLRIQSYALPQTIECSKALAPSLIDLDPQVVDVPRHGNAYGLATHLLLTSLSASEFVLLDRSEQPPAPGHGGLFSSGEADAFKNTPRSLEANSSAALDTEIPAFESQIGSIWAISSQTLLHTNQPPLQEDTASQLERFIDYCTIDVSPKRHILLVPQDEKPALAARIAEVADDLDLTSYDFDDALANLRPIFFKKEGIPQHYILFYQPNASSLNVLLEVFSSCWIEALELPLRNSGPASSSGRHSRDLQPGVLLGERYEITSRIGAGGFAVVYEARDTKVPREVAIKVIELERNLDERARQSYVKRFEREARLAVSVHHPCIVEVFDLGVTSDNVPYIVMERLNGWDLDSQLQRHGSMRPSRLLPLFIQGLEGLGCAHELDIVHKDLKPSNIFLKNPGKRHEQLCILDFGVARRINTTTARLTHTDSAFGTPHYMAPEYSTSQIATPALDVYQMGLILVEMLTGEPVVSHPEPVAAMFQHVRGDLMIPQELLESELGPIIRKALDANHLYRYQDAFEFADALRQIEDLSALPHIPSDAPKISIKPPSAHSDGIDSARQTPVIGAPLVHTAPRALVDETGSPVTPVLPEPTALAAPLIEEPALSPEISPFASTLPFDDLPEQLTSYAEHDTAADEPAAVLQQLYPPPGPGKSEGANARNQKEKPNESDGIDEALDKDVDLVDYSSKRPYVILISVLIVALLVVTVALLRNKRQLQTLTNDPSPTPEVVTAYDRQLAALRARADKLPLLLAEGKIEELLKEVETMDQSQVRLTPREVEQVQAIMEVARKERVNRAILDRAIELVDERQHERALDKLDTLQHDSVFWNHPDTRLILERAKTALLPQVQKLRDSGYPERARNLIEKLLIHEPQNTELAYLFLEITNDINSQPPSLLPIEQLPTPLLLEQPLSPSPDMGAASEDETNDPALPLDEPREEPPAR